MKRLLTLIAVCLLASLSISAQNPKTTSKMLYHDGPVLTGVQNIYVIWYGCWAENCGFAGDTKSFQLMFDFLITAGGRPYMQINSTYPDASGAAPSGDLALGGAVVDTSYSHGVELTKSDVVSIINGQINNFQLPQDPHGIYVVVASADVASNDTGFCIPSAPPHHGLGIVNGALAQYIFLGNPNRCPTLAAPQFISNGTRLPTPNDTFTGDALMANLAYALNGSLTNPRGNGWFDRYGLENADKCRNTFGQTYLTPNGARANVRLGNRDFLLPQNWVNDRRARCALSK